MGTVGYICRVSRAVRCRHVHLSDIGPRGFGVGEQGVRLLARPCEEARVSKQRVEHERAGPRHRVEGGDEGTEHGDLQVGF